MFSLRRSRKADTDSGHSAELPELVAEVPRFGEGEFLVAADPNPPRPIARSPEYIRRVLVSWLIGRPISQIAKRAGCSPRTVHSVIRTVVYVDEMDIEQGWARWCELGLVGALDARLELIPRSRCGRISFAETLVLTVCQVCHRAVGPVPFEDGQRGYDGSVIGAERLSRGLSVFEDAGWCMLARVQGHLMGHFELEADPLPRGFQPSKRQTDVMLLKAMRPGARIRPFIRRHYSGYVASHAIAAMRESQDQEAPSLLPLLDGRTLTAEQARRRWRKMLNPRASA